MRLLFLCLIALSSTACTTTHSYYVPEAGGYYTERAPQVSRSYVSAGVSTSAYWASPAYGYSDRFVFGFDHFGYSPSYIAYHYPIYLSGFYYDYFYSPRFYLSYSHWPRYAYHPYRYARYRPAYTYPHSWHYRPWHDHRRHRATAYTPRGELLRRRSDGYHGYHAYGERPSVRRDLVAATQRYAPAGGRAAYRLERPGDQPASGFQRGSVQASNATRREHIAAQRPRGMVRGGGQRHYSTSSRYSSGNYRAPVVRSSNGASSPRVRSTREALNRSTRPSLRQDRDLTSSTRNLSTDRSALRDRSVGSERREPALEAETSRYSPSPRIPDRSSMAPSTRIERYEPSTPRQEVRPTPRQEVRRLPQRMPSASPREVSPSPAPAQRPVRVERPRPGPSRSSRSLPSSRADERPRRSPR